MTPRRRRPTRQERGEHDGKVHERLRQLRHTEAYSQREVSEMTGIPYGTYRDWEDNRSVPRDGPHLRAFVEFFSTSALWVMRGEGPMQTKPRRSIDGD